MPTRLFGLDPLTDIISQFKQVHGEYMIPLFFIGFFIFGAISVYKQGKFRRWYIIAVLVIFLLSSQLALSIYPFTHAHRYSGISDSSETHFDMKLVDKDGQEIHSDERATLPFRDGTIVEHMIYVWDDYQRLHYAEKLINDHKKYHFQLERNSFWWRHPPPSAAHYWNESILSGYDDLIGLKIYSENITYGNKSHSVVKTETNCELKIIVEEDKVIRGC